MEQRRACVRHDVWRCGSFGLRRTRPLEGVAQPRRLMQRGFCGSARSSSSSCSSRGGAPRRRARCVALPLSQFGSVALAPAGKRIGSRRTLALAISSAQRFWPGQAVAEQEQAVDSRWLRLPPRRFHPLLRRSGWFQVRSVTQLARSGERHQPTRPLIRCRVGQPSPKPTSSTKANHTEHTSSRSQDDDEDGCALMLAWQGLRCRSRPRLCGGRWRWGWGPRCLAVLACRMAAAAPLPGSGARRRRCLDQRRRPRIKRRAHECCKVRAWIALQVAAWRATSASQWLLTHRKLRAGRVVFMATVQCVEAASGSDEPLYVGRCGAIARVGSRRALPAAGSVRTQLSRAAMKNAPTCASKGQRGQTGEHPCCTMRPRAAFKRKLPRRAHVARPIVLGEEPRSASGQAGRSGCRVAELECCARCPLAHALLPLKFPEGARRVAQGRPLCRGVAPLGSDVPSRREGSPPLARGGPLVASSPREEPLRAATHLWGSLGLLAVAWGVSPTSSLRAQARARASDGRVAPRPAPQADADTAAAPGAAGRAESPGGRAPEASRTTEVRGKARTATWRQSCFLPAVRLCRFHVPQAVLGIVANVEQLMLSSRSVLSFVLRRCRRLGSCRSEMGVRRTESGASSRCVGMSPGVVALPRQCTSTQLVPPY